MRSNVTECYLGLACKEKQLEQTNTSLEAILQNHKKCKIADGKTRGMFENLNLKYLIRTFDRENITADLITKLSIEDFKTPE